MANDWDGASDLVIVWNFDTAPGLLVPSVGTGTLTNVNSTTQDVDAKQGDRSAKFVALSSQSLALADASCPTGFPGKNADAPHSFSYCLWFEMGNIDHRQTLLDKFAGPGQKAYSVYFPNVGGTLRVRIGNGATTATDVDLSPDLVAGRWYHLGWTYDIADDGYKIRIWDDTAGSISHNVSGTFSTSVGASTSQFTIGNDDPSDFHAEMLFDELVAFSRILSTGEIDEIRSGTFGAGAVSTTVDSPYSKPYSKSYSKGPFGYNEQSKLWLKAA